MNAEDLAWNDQTNELLKAAVLRLQFILNLVKILIKIDVEEPCGTKDSLSSKSINI